MGYGVALLAVLAQCADVLDVNQVVLNGDISLLLQVIGKTQRGDDLEFVTGNNDVDGVFLLQWVKQHFPAMEGHIGAKLRQWGGNSSGVNTANIDNPGLVHPDTFWWHYSLGSVRERPFPEVWTDTSDPGHAGPESRATSD